MLNITIIWGLGGPEEHHQLHDCCWTDRVSKREEEVKHTFPKKNNTCIFSGFRGKPCTFPCLWNLPLGHQCSEHVDSCVVYIFWQRLKEKSTQYVNNVMQINGRFLFSTFIAIIYLIINVVIYLSNSLLINMYSLSTSLKLLKCSVQNDFLPKIV